jgi:hypothetical protein
MAVDGIAVAGMDVGEAGISAGFPDSEIAVFVDMGTGSVGDATVTARSHANITTIKIDRNEKIFFILNFLSFSIIAIWYRRLPHHWGSL